MSAIAPWELKYRKNAHHQQFDCHTKNYLDEFASMLPKGAKVLDVGCGDGRKSLCLLKKGFNVLGIDASKTAISHAKKLSASRFKVGNAARLPFRSNNFDAILSMAVYHCLLQSERSKFVREVRRVLRKGGIIYMLVLSSRDNTIEKIKTREHKTYLQPSGVTIHLSTETELKNDFKGFRFVKLEHRQRKVGIKNNAIFVIVLEKSEKTDLIS